MPACLKALCIFFFLLESTVVFLSRLTSSPKGHVGVTARKAETVILACTRAIWVAPWKRKISHWVSEFFQVFVGHNPWMCLIILHLFKIYKACLLLIVSSFLIVYVAFEKGITDFKPALLCAECSILFLSHQILCFLCTLWSWQQKKKLQTISFQM